MPFDGAGNFTRDPTTRIANQGALVSAQVNTETDNAVIGINGKVNLDGKLTHTGLQVLFGDGTAVANPTTVRQVQQGIVSKASAVGGTVDAITITMSPASVAWVNKETFEWISGGANTVTTPTINKDGLGAKTIVSATGGALVAGATGVSGVLNRGYYDGTNVRLLTPQTATIGASTINMTAKAINEAKGAAVASATTTDIWTPADGNYVHVTGTTTITSLGTAPQAGAERTVVFDGILTLTHNGTSLILPGAANITTAAGDRMIVRADTTANMNVIAYTKADGTPVVSSSGGMTELGRQAPTTGATFSFTGLALTGYKKLRIVGYSAKVAGATPIVSVAGVSTTLILGTTATLLVCEIDLTGGTGIAWGGAGTTVPSMWSGPFASGISTATTSIAVSIASNTYAATNLWVLEGYK